MLRRAKAIGYEDEVKLQSGACQPLIVRALLPDGEVFDAYLKLTDKLNLGKKALIIETIASMLAADLCLPTPEPYLVTITPEFIESCSEEYIQRRFRASCTEAFGTRAIGPDVNVVTRGYLLKREEQLQAAANIFTFDALIENLDRGGNNQKPNCLISEGQFYVFDHEKAFQRAAGIPLLGAGNLTPWSLGGLNYYSTPDTHLFINQLRGKASKLNFNPFVTRWKELTDERLNEYIGALPPEWINDAANEICAKKIATSIRDIRDNIDAAIDEVIRVLEVRNG